MRFAQVLLLAALANGRRERSNEIQQEIEGLAHELTLSELEQVELKLLESIIPPQKAFRTGRKGLPSQYIADTEEEELDAFIKWTAAYGKDYREAQGFDEKMAIWKETNKKIRDTNQEAEQSGDLNAVVLEHNHLSDFT
jgi:hypothetical protein